MITSKKIGVGVVTYNRPEQFNKLFSSLQNCKDKIDHLCIYEDSVGNNPEHVNYIYSEQLRWKGDNTLMIITTDSNTGVGVAKNQCLNHLLNKGCDYIFLIEDDIFIKDPKVFEKYIEASDATGIQHFNFSQHGVMNKAYPGGVANPRTVLNYESAKINIPLYPHCVGAFSFYTKRCLEQVGLLDERYYNACEHVDHTLQIIKAGMHPPFWTFPDIENSWEYLGDEEWSHQQSTITSRPDHNDLISDADKIFLEKNGCYPGQIPIAEIEEVVESIKQIKKTYAI